MGVVEKSLEFARTRRETGQVECDPAQQCASVCGRRGPKSGLLQLAENESIDGIADPGGISNAGRLVSIWFDECPMTGLWFSFRNVAARKQDAWGFDTNQKGDTSAG
jgi:hypothetical protein